MKTLLTILCGTSFFSFFNIARADWQGDIVVKTPQQKAITQVTGKIFGKKDKQRIDVQAPMQMSTIVDLKNKKAWNLIHPQKIVMDLNFQKATSHIPNCNVENIDSCLIKQGFHKAGEETVDTHPCTIYESTKNKMNIKIWRPKDLLEVPTVKMVSKNAEGKVVAESEITNLVHGSQPDSKFVVPKDYQNVGNLQNLFKGFGGN